MRDEGVIKFHCDWKRMSAKPFDAFEKMKQWRKKFFDLKMIGVYDDGIGYGNISVKSGKKSFVITGTQTGARKNLELAHCAEVTDYDFDQNRVTCEGEMKASSESLTHAMFYELSPEIRAIIHVHDRPLWDALKDKAATTGEEIPYGTPAMAREVKRLFESGAFKKNKLLVMAGHEEGLISFGRDLDEAGEVFLSCLRECGLKF